MNCHMALPSLVPTATVRKRSPSERERSLINGDRPCGIHVSSPNACARTSGRGRYQTTARQRSQVLPRYRPAWGYASVAARKAQIAAELEGVAPGEAPIVEPFPSPVAVTPVSARPPMTLSQVLADLESSDPRLPAASNRQKSLADMQVERDFARFVAHIRKAESEGEDEPWDPWR